MIKPMRSLKDKHNEQKEKETLSRKKGKKAPKKVVRKVNKKGRVTKKGKNK